jgi:hypothetical protein
MRVKIFSYVGTGLDQQLSTLNIHHEDELELTEEELGKLMVDITKRKAKHWNGKVVVNLQVMLRLHDDGAYILAVDIGNFKQR